MEQRSLGRGGPRVGPLAFGAMSFAGYYGAADDAEGVRAITRALDLGITLIDTAEAYGDGTNEELVGRAIAGRRDEVVLATKASRRQRRELPAPAPSTRSLRAPRAWTTSTSTTCTASTRACRSRRPSARWPALVRPGRSATSASPRRGPRPSGAPTPSTRSPPSRASTPCCIAIPRTRSCRWCASSASPTWRTARSSRGLLTGRYPHARRPGARRLAPRGPPLPGREPGPQHGGGRGARRDRRARVGGPGDPRPSPGSGSGPRGDPARGQQPRRPRRAQPRRAGARAVTGATSRPSTPPPRPAPPSGDRYPASYMPRLGI